ncbi:MAG: DUF3611 family protein [Leptolyngbyaceae cyanobacterium]
MTGELEYSLSPAIRRISGSLRRFGWLSFWCQFFLGIISSVILLLPVLSQGSRTAGNNPGAGTGLFFSACGLVALCLGAYWSFRYTRTARQLRGRDESRRPRPKDVIRLLKFGLFVSLGGMLLTLLGAQAVAGSLILKALSQGFSLAGPTLDFSGLIKPLDMFVVQASTNILLAHFANLACTLWVLNAVNRA